MQHCNGRQHHVIDLEAVVQNRSWGIVTPNSRGPSSSGELIRGNSSLREVETGSIERSYWSQAAGFRWGFSAPLRVGLRYAQRGREWRVKMVLLGNAVGRDVIERVFEGRIDARQ